MRVLIASDIHGKLTYLLKMIEKEKPDILVYAGDLGLYEEFDTRAEDILDYPIPKAFIYGNHDEIFLITNRKNKDFTWLPSFIPKEVKGLRILGINGNIAKRTRFEWHTTERTIREELRLCLYAKPKRINLIVSHECPFGYADTIQRKKIQGKKEFTWSKHVGFSSLFKVLDKLKPNYYVCGHLHRQQIDIYENTLVMNPGYGRNGDYILLDTLKRIKDLKPTNLMRNLNEMGRKRKENISKTKSKRNFY